MRTWQKETEKVGEESGRWDEDWTKMAMSKVDERGENLGEMLMAITGWKKREEKNDRGLLTFLVKDKYIGWNVNRRGKRCIGIIQSDRNNFSLIPNEIVRYRANSHTHR